MAPIVLLLCAVVPWLVPWPWQNLPESSTAESVTSTAAAPVDPGSDITPGTTSDADPIAADGDFEGPADVLNYALTLEYLEAEFYRQGNAADLLNGKEAKYLKQIQADEEAHVWAIKDTLKKLGFDAVSAPKVDFGGAFKSKNSYLEAAYTFENLGVQAYLGAAPSLFKEKALLSAAASIFGVEARHAAIIGSLQGKKAEGGVYQGALETPADKNTVLKAAAPFIVSAQTL